MPRRRSAVALVLLLLAGAAWTYLARPPRPTAVTSASSTLPAALSTGRPDTAPGASHGVAAHDLHDMSGPPSAVALGASGGHGAHSGAVDWAALSDRDLDVATIFVTARRRGVSAALDSLRALIARDPGADPMGHVVAHALGRFAVARAGGDPATYAQCTQEFQAGCWHGVMEGYFTSPRASPAVAVAGASLDALCGTIAGARSAPLARLECAHGMGHGLMARVHNDYRTALGQCDALSDSVARRECHDGVFMEITVRGTEPRAGTNDATLLRRADLRWPCDSVASTYQPSCWQYQPIVLYEFTDDLARTARTCATVPAASREACHHGLGKQLGGWVDSSAELVATCRLADTALTGVCVAGAAESFIDESWTAGKALALCRDAPANAKGACYAMVGRRMALVHPARGAVARDCAAAEAAYVAVCVRGRETPGPVQPRPEP